MDLSIFPAEDKTDSDVRIFLTRPESAPAGLQPAVVQILQRGLSAAIRQIDKVGVTYNKTPRIISAVCGICALILICVSGASLSNERRVLEHVYWMEYNSETPANGMYVVHSADLAAGFTITSTDLIVAREVVRQGQKQGQGQGYPVNLTVANAVPSIIDPADVLLYLRVQRQSRLGLASISEVEVPVWCTVPDSLRVAEFEAKSGALPRCSLPPRCDAAADESNAVQYCDDEVLLFGLEAGMSKTFANREYQSVFEISTRHNVFKNEPTSDGGR